MPTSSRIGDKVLKITSSPMRDEVNLRNRANVPGFDWGCARHYLEIMIEYFHHLRKNKMVFENKI